MNYSSTGSSKLPCLPGQRRSVPEDSAAISLIAGAVLLQTEMVGDSPQLAAYARAHRLGLLPDRLRENGALQLETAALSDLDVSFFDDEKMLQLLPPMRLVKLGLALRANVLPAVSERIDDITADAELDEDPDAHLKKLINVLDHVAASGVADSGALTLIEEARKQMRRSVEILQDRKRETR
jgi:hypothetical protein